MKPAHIQRRRDLKAQCKRQNAKQADYLAARMRERCRCVLGGLQHVACRAGCAGEWVAAHVYPMAARHPEILTYGRAPA